MKNVLLRVFYIFLQLLFIAFSLALIALGIWLIVRGQTFRLLVSDVEFSGFGIATITIGAVIIVIACIGIVGALCETNVNKVLLAMYIFFVGLLFVIELGIGVLVFVYRDTAHDILTDSLNETLYLYGGNGSEGQPATDGWDQLQRNLDCCGVRGYQNWTDNTELIPGLNSSVTYPLSCCIDEASPQCGTDVGMDVIYQEGCLGAILRELDKNIVGVSAIGIAFLVGEVLVILISICLLCFGGRGHD